MLTLTNISLERDRVVIFEDLNLTVHAGQRVGVVGKNGIGKSTLFELILGRLTPDAGDVTKPRDWRISHLAQHVNPSERPALEYVIDGHQALRRAERKLSAAEAAGDDMRIAGLHAELDDLGAYQASARAGEILHGLGFSGADATRPYAQFSGGWRIRLNLAQALMAPADLLLLDEPTNHLDLEATLWLESWLQRCESTVLTIAHDRDFLDNVVDHIVHLSQHNAQTYQGNYSAFERQRAERLLRQQASYARQQKQVQHIEQFVSRFRAKASKAKQVQSRLKALEKMEAVAAVHAESPYALAFTNPDRMSHPLLSLRGVAVGYDETPILSNINESVLPGARIGVLGENGAGKTTLLKCLVGDLAPLAGEFVRGQHASIGYFAQHQLETLNAQMSALVTLQKAHPEEREQWCRDYLASWGFPGDKIDRPIATLSGGERARLVLALIAATKPAVLVLDEPTNHLDLDMRDALALALQDYSGAMIIVAHDRSLLSRTVDEYWLVEGGTVTRLAGTLDTYTSSHTRTGAENAGTPAESGPGKARGHPPGQSADDAAANGQAKPSDRKAQRQHAARQREREQPLKSRIRKLEARIEQLSGDLKALEAKLADPEIYHNAPANELDALLKEAGKVRKKRDDAEQEWLTTCEELEEIQLS